MNGLTATGVTVGICAGLWQLVSSHVGLSQGWELLGTIGFVAFCSFYAAGGGKSGFIRSLAVNYSGMVWAFFAALAAASIVYTVVDNSRMETEQQIDDFYRVEYKKTYDAQSGEAAVSAWF